MDVLAWLAPKVARYKQPKRIVFWDEIPRSGYGKVSKKVIRAELEARGCLSSDEKTAAKHKRPKRPGSNRRERWTVASAQSDESEKRKTSCGAG